MRSNELRHDVFVCRHDLETYKKADRTRNRNRRRKSMSGTPAWASGGRKPESLDDNDTFAYRKHGNQGSAWDMLQRERVLQGVRRSARTGPTYSVPHRAEWMKTGSVVQVKRTCSLIRRVEIKIGWKKACENPEQYYLVWSCCYIFLLSIKFSFTGSS